MRVHFVSHLLIKTNGLSLLVPRVILCQRISVTWRVHAINQVFFRISTHCANKLSRYATSFDHSTREAVQTCSASSLRVYFLLARGRLEDALGKSTFIILFKTDCSYATQFRISSEGRGIYYAKSVKNGDMF